MQYVVSLNNVNMKDVMMVGGKNASTGEMIQHLSAKGVKVPGGFATTLYAYQEFISANQLESKIIDILKTIKNENIHSLQKASNQIRRLIISTPFSNEFVDDITKHYSKLKNAPVAVRSSSSCEDSEEASFAGQQDTFLNVKGIKQVLHAIKLVYGSFYTPRAISYRLHKKFNYHKNGMSVGIQPMIRSDKGASGVVFTLDTESGFDKIILITGTYGLGETIVQGKVNPDEFYVYKPSLEAKKFPILERKLGNKKIKMVYTGDKNPTRSTKIISVPKNQKNKFCIDDKDVQILAKHALTIEKHYGKPMDIEWAKDGITGEIYIVQARPETVKAGTNNESILERFILSKAGKVLVKGQSVGQKIGSGNVKVVKNSSQMHLMKQGDILVTDMTDPDWEPIMKLAAGIVTNQGGRTCHAAIIARELGIPAVVGCHDATQKIKHNTPVTVSCAEGQIGIVYEGKIPFKVNKLNVKELPKLGVNLCLNVGNPSRAFSGQFLPNQGVGLARLEFIISDMIGIHPNALLSFKKLPKKLQKEINAKIESYSSPVEFYIEKMREGIATIAAAFSPKQVIFRFSDFKTNEYANLLGGSLFEPKEENPMIGFRGASRYTSEQFRDCFELECIALKRVREQMGLVNAQVMIPFVRTVNELKATLKLMEEFGLKRGTNDLKIFMMCEIPSNIILAEEFLEHVDGYSIGSNDLTQLTLGLDRDSSLISSIFDERNDAVKALLHKVIKICNEKGKYIGICGQAPSDYPDFAKWLMEEKIQSISLTSDTVLDTWLMLAGEEKRS